MSKSDSTIQVIESTLPGPTLLVLGGVHGDEQCGVDLVRSILTGAYSPVIRRGKLIAALGNLAAIDAGKRCILHNLNRGFLPDKIPCNCAECARIDVLKKLMNDADVLLDIHASFTPESETFLICERNAISLIEALPMEKVCFGFDTVQPGGTDYYMNSIGKVGICVECGYLGDPRSAEYARTSFETLLATMGMIDESLSKKCDKKFFQARYQYFTRTDFRLAKPLSDFEEVREGQMIGLDGEREVRVDRNGAVLFAGNKIDRGREAFVFLTKESMNK